MRDILLLVTGQAMSGQFCQKCFAWHDHPEQTCKSAVEAAAAELEREKAAQLQDTDSQYSDDDPIYWIDVLDGVGDVICTWGPYDTHGDALQVSGACANVHRMYGCALWSVDANALVGGFEVWVGLPRRMAQYQLESPLPGTIRPGELDNRSPGAALEILRGIRQALVKP